jgi:hypothetical protein
VQGRKSFPLLPPNVTVIDCQPRITARLLQVTVSHEATITEIAIVALGGRFTAYSSASRRLADH